MSAVGEDLSACSSEQSPAGWHERGWRWQRADGSQRGHLWWKWARFSFHNRHWQNNPGAARSTVALSDYCQPRQEDWLHTAMCEVPIEAHKPSKLHVLRGMTNKGLQSFEKAEFLDNYPNQISESFEDGLSPLRGSVLQGTGRSCNCLTSFRHTTILQCAFPSFLVLLSQTQKLGIPMCWVSEMRGTWETTRKPWGESSFSILGLGILQFRDTTLCSILPLCGKMLLYIIKFNCSEKLLIWFWRIVSLNLK